MCGLLVPTVFGSGSNLTSIHGLIGCFLVHCLSFCLSLQGFETTSERNVVIVDNSTDIIVVEVMAVAAASPYHLAMSRETKKIWAPAAMSVVFRHVSPVPGFVVPSHHDCAFLSLPIA